MGLAAIAACIVLAAVRQDPAAPTEAGDATVTLPPALSARPSAPEAAPLAQAAPEPVKPGARAAIPVEEPRRASRPLEERPEAGPGITSFFVGSFAVVGFLGGAFLLLKRLGRHSRFLGSAGAIQVLARKAIGQKQEIFLIEAGGKVFMIGSTRDRLSTLGEFASPDEVAALRAGLPERREDSHRAEFNQVLREGLHDAEADGPAKPGPREERVFASIADELAEIRKTVRAWRA